MTPTTIELPPNHTAIIIDETGRMVELYMPDHDDDHEVPSKIVEVLNLLLDDI